MNIYKISCYSACGSYFMPYLKSITVIANNKEEVKDHAKNYNFIYPSDRWNIELLCSNIENIKDITVIDKEESSDY